MLIFNDLSKTQKKFVIAALNTRPELRDSPEVTLKECSEIYFELKDQRTGARGDKIGYPNWLFANNKISRGLYQLPIPTQEEVAKFTAEMNKPKVEKPKKIKVKNDALDSAKQDAEDLKKLVDPDMVDFLDELRANGIEV